MRLVTLLVALVSSFWQNANPLLSSAPSAARHLSVSTSASATTVKPGAKAVLFVDVSPNPGIHVYAPGAKGYLPIALTLEAPSGVKVGRLAYPKSEIYFFVELNERMPVYQKPFRLSQDVVIAPASKAGTTVTVTGTVKYQACDDKVCFAPVSVPVAWSLNVI